MECHSTEILSLLVTDHHFKAIYDMKVTAMVLISLSKAFDSISLATLLNELKSLGASTNALNWFQSYLTNKEQTTRIREHPYLHRWKQLTQGSIFGPVLFSLYMSDLPDIIWNCSVESCWWHWTLYFLCNQEKSRCPKSDCQRSQYCSRVVLYLSPRDVIYGFSQG